MNTINKISLLLCAGLVLSASAQAKDEYTKEWKKDYTVNADAAFKLKSKFSDVNVTTWDQNTISVHFLVKVDESNEDKAQKVLDAISVKEVSASSSAVSLETILEDKNMDDVTIVYTIKMPSSIRIDLDNDFGSSFLASMSAPVTVDIDYGNLRAEKLEGKGNVLNMDFSSAELDGLSDAEVTMTYGSLEIDDAGKLVLKSSFSAIDIDHAVSLDAKSSYDAFEIDDIGSLSMSSSFSSAEIDKLSGALKAELEYGSLEVDEIAAAFTTVDITGGFSSIEIGFANGASYALNAKVKAGEIEGPDNIDAKVKVSPDHMQRILAGTVGSSPGARTVTIDISQGSVEIE
ncbi:MAG: hypothetical protein HQ500_08590 [Flavobacteriales bacterium]|nr:hypothetical protein [Flavobacteriales bacterium]